MSLQGGKGCEIGDSLKDCTFMEILVDDVIVTRDESVDAIETTSVNPDDKMNYWLTVVVLLKIACLLLSVVIIVK